MQLTPNIVEEVLEYLLLEYGESSNDPEALKLSDLSYRGEHLHHGVPTHFWEYPSRHEHSWAIVQPYGESYLVGMCFVAPGAEPHPPPKKWWQFWGRASA